MNLKKMEGYLRVNLLGPGPRLVEKEFTGPRSHKYWESLAQRLGRGIALLFHDRSTRSGWVVSSTSRPHFTPGKDPVPILKEAVWTGAGNLVASGIRSRAVQPVVNRDWATGPTIS